MSRDHRPPIRNPFLPSTPEEPEAPTRDGGHPAGDGGDDGAPAASTARPDIASTLNRTSRSIPAMPMADKSAPMVVGIRQTSRAPAR